MSMDRGMRPAHDMPAGVIFMPSCYANATVNLLRNSAFDPMGCSRVFVSRAARAPAPTRIAALSPAPRSTGAYKLRRKAKPAGTRHSAAAEICGRVRRPIRFGEPCALHPAEMATTGASALRPRLGRQRSSFSIDLAARTRNRVEEAPECARLPIDKLHNRHSIFRFILEHTPMLAHNYRAFRKGEIYV